jgi:signal transduction histidine kinase
MVPGSEGAGRPDGLQSGEPDTEPCPNRVRYCKLFDRVNIAVAVYRAVDDGQDFVFEEFNDAGCRAEKVEKADVIGRRVTEAFPGVREFGLLDVFREVHRTGEPKEHPVRWYEDDRIAGWRENHVYKLPTGEVVAIYEDVTERKRYEEALSASEARCEALFNTMSEGVCLHELVFDCDGKPIDYRILDVNPAYEKLTTLRRRDVVGALASVVYGTGKPPYLDVYVKVARTGEPTSFETFFEPMDKHFVISVFSPERDRFATVFFDVTAQRRADEERRNIESKMMQTQKLESLGVLAGGIAHDFNNLLMGILGYADLAMLEIPKTPPAAQYIAEVENATRQAAELCKQMLAYSGKGRFVLERLLLHEVVEEMVQLLRVSISKHAVLKLDFAPDLPTIEADRSQIRQVVMNLVINASESLKDKSGVISLVTGIMGCDDEYLADTVLADELTDGQYVYLEVSDSGCGMDAETKSKIFEPFFTTKFTGRGLGLAAVLGIVRGHRGAIKVYSEPGRGTTVKVLFPAVFGKPKLTPSFATVVDASWADGLVLVADDESSARTVTKLFLEKAGFRVLLASDGHEAVEVFKAHSDEISAVILDLTMPGMGGEEVFRELRRIRPNVKVIVSSGYNEAEVTPRFAGKGLAGFIQKPYKFTVLVEKLKEIL